MWPQVIQYQLLGDLDFPTTLTTTWRHDMMFFFPQISALRMTFASGYRLEHLLIIDHFPQSTSQPPKNIQVMVDTL